MGVIVPEDIKVLSNEFKDFVKELANEVNRVSEAYADLQRVRAMSPSSGGESGPTDFLFYVVENAVDPEPQELDGLFFVKYNGKVVDTDGSTVTTIADGVQGFDFGTVINEPTVMPPQAEIVGQDVHSLGTVIACKHYSDLNAAVFSSVRPRLQVECVPEGLPE